MSEVVDIPPGSLDSSLWVIQPSISHNLLCVKVKQAGRRYTQPCHPPFPILSQSVVPCPVLTAAFWPAYRFLRRQVRWSAILISLRIFQSLFWSTQSKAFMYSMKQKFSWNSLAFSMFSLCIWKFSVHVLLKPILKDFERYCVSMWNEGNWQILTNCNCLLLMCLLRIHRSYKMGWLLY